MAIQKPRGTADLLPNETRKWQYVEEIARMTFADYQFQEVRTPMFESYDLFSRSVGETSDIVSKEMYDFYDKGDRHVALRPEGTAPVVRAYVENKLFGPEHTKPYKVYYMGPMFRYERPKNGRMRQFHQLGVEAFGSENPATDVEVMALAMSLFDQLGLKHLKLVINSLGDIESRIAHKEALLAYLTPHFDELSEDSKRRFEKNPLRILDSKDAKDIEIVEAAPSILDYLNEASKTYFETIKTMLEALDIPYEVDATMVRGLDYYNHTIFEIMSDAPAFGGTATTICAGGRYNGLVEELGGPSTPGFGFGLGVERLLMVLDTENVEIPDLHEVEVYVMGLGEATNIESLKLVQAARDAGLSAERDYLNRKMKGQFKAVDKLGAKTVLIIGEDELEKGVARFKVLATGKEVEVPLEEIYQDFRKFYNIQTTDMTAFNEFFNKDE